MGFYSDSGRITCAVTSVSKYAGLTAGSRGLARLQVLGGTCGVMLDVGGEVQIVCRTRGQLSTE